MKLFELDERQEKKFAEWRDKHEKTCPLTPDKVGAIGGKLTFTFTPTSLGCIMKVKCACGIEDSEVDLSMYEDW